MINKKLQKNKGHAQSVNTRGNKNALKVPTFSAPRVSTAGFSIVEALVAITVLVTSIAGPLTIANRGISTARLATDQVTAFFLGQEGIEVVRYIRESNILDKDPWMTGLSQCIGSYCTIDGRNENITVCPGQGLCDNLEYIDSTGFYGYGSGSSWVETRFNREFTLTQLAPNEIAIDVTVSWTTGSQSRSITVHESMFNWQ